MTPFQNLEHSRHDPFSEPLGNVQLFTGMKPNDPQDGYDGKGPSVRVGDHEKGHTYQYQLFGPLFLPAYFASGGISGSNPFEKGADNYSRGKSWFPSKK